MRKLKRTEHKVDFVVAGAQKSGTRALGRFLSQHPDITLVHGPHTEPHFFDRKKFFRDVPDYDLYHSWIATEDREKTTGDITPIYLYWKPAIPRIYAYNPKMKFIVLLRNPVNRVYSQWVMQNERGKEPYGFSAALLMEPFRWMRYGQHWHFSYLQRSFYSKQIKRLYAYFPNEQCLILKTEELRLKHHATMRKIYEFLGVSSDETTEPEIINSRDYEPMPPAVRRALSLLYDHEMRSLEKLLEWDCQDWRAGMGYID